MSYAVLGCRDAALAPELVVCARFLPLTPCPLRPQERVPCASTSYIMYHVNWNIINVIFDRLMSRSSNYKHRWNKWTFSKLQKKSLALSFHVVECVLFTLGNTWLINSLIRPCCTAARATQGLFIIIPYFKSIESNHQCLSLRQYLFKHNCT